MKARADSTNLPLPADSARGQPVDWLLIALWPGLHELRRANDGALSPALGWIVRPVARNEIIHLPSQSDTAHHLHFRWRAQRVAAISASISASVKPSVPLTAAACYSAVWAWSTRTPRKSERVDSTDAAARRRSTATGRPLDVVGPTECHVSTGCGSPQRAR